MNTTLPTSPGRMHHPPQPTTTPPERRRVGLLDRMALHLGVALVTWSRRPRRTGRPLRRRLSRSELVLRHEQRRAQVAREHDDQLRLLRSGAWRR